MGHQIGSQISPRPPPAVIVRILPNLSDIGAIPTMNALEILREAVRILRADPSTFMTIFVLLICPVSTALLSNFLLNQSFVDVLGSRLMFIAITSGLPPAHFLKQMCHHLSGIIVSSVFCFPLLITFLLLARACVAYSVACSYANREVVITELKGMIVGPIMRRFVLTYVWICASIVGIFTVFSILIFTVCSSFAALGYPPEIVIYPALLVLLGFSVAYAHVIIVCNVASVISVLEDASGLQALLLSTRLINGHTETGLLLFLGTTIGLAFVEGLFEHRVKTLSYGDGSSRIWEGPLLVLMYSFVLLVDSMMITVFYFTHRAFSMDVFNGNEQGLEELESFSSESDNL